MKKSVFAVLAVLLLAALFVGGVSAEKVIAGVDDLAGAKIGVQIGTTGHIYATTYEGDEAGTTVTPYNKGADAISSEAAATRFAGPSPVARPICFWLFNCF